MQNLIAEPLLILLLEVAETEFRQEVLNHRNLMVNHTVGDQAVVALVPVFEELVVEVRVDER